jgi:hypothetical protein
MRASEAMMLGSATMKMVAGDINSCAIGAALNAMGCEQHGVTIMPKLVEGLEGLAPDEAAFLEILFNIRRTSFDLDVKFHNRQEDVVRLFPWMCAPHAQRGLPPSSLPVALTTDHLYKMYFSAGSQMYTCGSLVALLFDHYVVGGLLSFESLVDWVRSIEPECGECRSFECSCAETAANGTRDAYEEALGAMVTAEDAASVQSAMLAVQL